MGIRVENVYKTFQSTEGTVTALNGVTLDVPRQTVTTLLGPSGCGKTTLLRCIAGLETPDSGSISIGGNVVWSNADNRTTFVTPDKRGIGMVFQTYAIWPHMTVYDNVAYPLEAQGVARGDIPGKVARALEFVQLGGYERRPATALSGGQQQRVSLARAIVSEPDVILFDEPLSNLDAKLREETRTELRQLLTHLGVTALYVTHDRFEALALSDDVVVMQEGEIVQRGTPEEVYFRSRSRFVVDFIGKANFIDGTVVEADGRVADEIAAVGEMNGSGSPAMIVDSAIGPLLCAAEDDVAPGTRGTVSIRMEFVEAHPRGGQQAADGGEAMDTPGAVTNRVPGVVSTALFLGEYRELEVLVGDVTLMLRAESTSAWQAGDEVELFLHPGGCRFLPESEE